MAAAVAMAAVLEDLLQTRTAVTAEIMVVVAAVPATVALVVAAVMELVVRFALYGQAVHVDSPALALTKV